MERGDVGWGCITLAGTVGDDGEPFKPYLYGERDSSVFKWFGAFFDADNSAFTTWSFSIVLLLFVVPRYGEEGEGEGEGEEEEEEEEEEDKVDKLSLFDFVGCFVCLFCSFAIVFVGFCCYHKQKEKFN